MTYKIYSLFTNASGSRYHQMINQGLIDHPHAKPIFNEPVKSFDRILAPGLFNAKAMLEADLIFMPGSEHYQLSVQETALFREHNLWQKTVVYDFSDSSKIDDALLGKCLLYVKRSWPPWDKGAGPKLLYVPYGALHEYDVLAHEAQSIDILFSMTPDPKSSTQIRRMKAYNILKGLELEPEFYRINISLGQFTASGRRSILDQPYDGHNEFLQYMIRLRQAKVIVHVQPDHLGGDSRLWEALLSGSPVVCPNLSAQKLGLIDGRHYISFDPDDPDMLKTKLRFLLMGASTRRTLAENARDYVQRHHMPINRVDTILRYLERFKR